jgi:hypothetical protein
MHACATILVKDLTLLFFSPPFSKMFLFSPFLFKLLDFITLFTLVLLKPLRGVIFIWTRIVFLTDQVIFVPEWPKGKFVRL